jgi:HEAT repeat protein
MLTHLRDPRAVVGITSLLGDPAAAGYWPHLVRCLIELNDPQASGKLLEIARNKGGDPNIRSEIARALIYSADREQAKQAAAVLIDCLNAPGLVAPLFVVDTLAKTNNVDAFIGFLKDAQAGVPERQRAACNLSWLKLDSTTRERFISLLDDKSIDRSVRVFVAEGLTRIFNTVEARPQSSDPRVAAFLIKAFQGTQDGDPVRTGIARALAYTNDAKGLDTLAEALMSASETLRRDAAIGLGSARDARALDVLIALLDHSDSRTVADFYGYVDALSNAPTVSDEMRKKAKAAVVAALPKVRESESRTINEAMDRLSGNGKPEAPPPPPAKGDF